MKKKFVVLTWTFMLCWFQSGKALIAPNPNHPYHFCEVEVDKSVVPPQTIYTPFYLLSKSAYQLLNTEDFPNESDWHQIIDFAHAQGFNSVRIWMIWANYVPGEETACNDFKAWPWETAASYNGGWHLNFSEDYWTRLRQVLRYLDSLGMEAELCILDWGGLSLMPWNGLDAEGSKFMIYPISDNFYPHMKQYLDKIIDESGSWPNNWRFELGNQLNDAWKIHEGGDPYYACPDQRVASMDPYPETPEETHLDHYYTWISEVGGYLRGELDEKYGESNHMVTNSSSKATSDYPTNEEAFWSKDMSWNVPIEFHGSRTSDWYLDNYIRYYQHIRGTDLPENAKPVVDGEPNKYHNIINAQPDEGGNFYDKDNPEEGRWNFYIGAMAGCYPTYHSEYATFYPTEENDIGSEFVERFSGILQNEDFYLSENGKYEFADTFWYEMEPDFYDSILDQLFLFENKYLYSDGLKPNMVFPLRKEDMSGVAEKGFIYLLKPRDHGDMPIKYPLVLLLDPETFPDGTRYRFTWYSTVENKHGKYVLEQSVQCMGPGTRYLEIPEKIKDFMNEDGKCDAIVHFKKISDSCPVKSEFRNHFAPSSALSLVGGPSFKPGDQCKLELNTVFEDGSESKTLFSERTVVLKVNDEEMFYYDQSDPSNWKSFIVSNPQLPIKAGSETFFDITWPFDLNIQNIYGTFYAAYWEPQQFLRNDTSSTLNPGLVLMEECPFNFTQKSSLIRHVKVDGDDSNDGMSPATAWKTISHAIDSINISTPPPSEQTPYRIILGPGDFVIPKDGVILPAFTSIVGKGPVRTKLKSITGSYIALPDLNNPNHPSINSISYCTLDKVSVALYSSVGYFFNNHFLNCIGDDDWAPIFAIDSEARVKNCLFVDNENGLIASNSLIEVKDCTLDNNNYGLRIYGDLENLIGTIKIDDPIYANNNIITNSIITNSSTAAIKLERASLRAAYCCFYDNQKDFEIDNTSFFAQYKNLFVDPLYVNLSVKNYNLQQSAADPSQGDSPCVDTGRNIQVPFDLNYGSTRSDLGPDVCQLDRGYRTVEYKVQSEYGAILEPQNGSLINEIINGTKLDEVMITKEGDSDSIIQLVFNSDPCSPVVIDPGLIENPTDISLIDVNGDGYNDLIVTTESGSIIYENDQNGNFIVSGGNSNGFDYLVNSTLTGDINQDDQKDLIYCCQDGVRVFLGPIAKKTTPDLHLNIDNAQSAYIGVLDNQKKTSLVAIDKNGDINVFFDPFSNSKTRTPVVLEPTYAESLHLIDINNDGLTDIQVIGSGEEYLNDGRNGFTLNNPSFSMMDQDSVVR